MVHSWRAPVSHAKDNEHSYLYSHEVAMVIQQAPMKPGQSILSPIEASPIDAATNRTRHTDRQTSRQCIIDDLSPMANDARHVLHANNTAKVLLVIFCLTQSTQLLSFIILLGFDYIFLFIDVPTLPLFVSFIYVSILCLGVLVAVKRSQFGLAAYALFCAIHTGYSFFMLLVLGGSIDYHRFHTPFAGKSPAPHSIIELLDAPDTLQWYIDSNAAPFGYAAAVTFGEGHGETALYWLMTQLSWQLVLAMMGGGFGLALRWAYKQQELAWKLYGADATHEEHNDTNNTSNNNNNNNNNSHVGTTKPQEQTVEQQFCEVPL